MVEFIAEIGGSHQGDVGRLRELIQTAESCGFDSVKLQWIESVEDVYRKGFPGKVQTLPKDLNLEDVRKWSGGMRLGFSVFNEAHIAKLKPFSDFWKVSSYDAGRQVLIDFLGQTGKPVHVSLGLHEIIPLKSGFHHPASALLHCVSKYPCGSRECFLKGIELRMRQALEADFSWGYSDHSGLAASVYRAVHHWGSQVVEMHLGLNAWGHRWGPLEAEEAIINVRLGLSLDDGLPDLSNERKWMADPSDGRRPLKKYEDELRASLEVSA